MSPRSRIEIYAEILECCRKGATTSTVIHACNLKYPIFKESIEFLKSRNLIEELEEESKVFRNTEKGNEALKSYADYYLKLFREPLTPFTRKKFRP